MNCVVLGLVGSVLQSILNSSPALVFNSIKKFMFEEGLKNIRTELDKTLETALGDSSFPNSISPLDMAIAESRQKVRTMGYDPFKVKDYNHTADFFSVQLTNTVVTGVSSFYRVGDLAVSMDNNTLTAGSLIRIKFNHRRILRTIVSSQCCRLERKS